jgi:hypothetical protein
MHKRCSPPDNGCAASAPTDCKQLLNVVAMRLHFPSRSFAFASKALALATALSLGLSSFSLQTMGNDTQEIKLGSHVFLVSREWISDGSVTISPEPEKGPPSEPNLRSATELSFRPRAGWLGGSGTALPTIIRVVAAVWDRPPPNSQLSKWLDKVASTAADDDGVSWRASQDRESNRRRRRLSTRATGTTWGNRLWLFQITKIYRQVFDWTR